MTNYRTHELIRETNLLRAINPWIFTVGNQELVRLIRFPVCAKKIIIKFYLILIN